MSEVPAYEHNPQGEWQKFFILVIILVGVILVVALLRPLIFGRIVPAILGENLPQTTEVIEPIDSSAEEGEETDNAGGSSEAEATEEMVDDADSLSEEESSNNQTVQDETDPEDDSAEDNRGDEADDEQQTHTVRSGETLLQIARQYEVTTADIISANNITNPNVVRIGEELIIPTK